jgi:hypothetical protein
MEMLGLLETAPKHLLSERKETGQKRRFGKLATSEQKMDWEFPQEGLLCLVFRIQNWKHQKFPVLRLGDLGHSIVFQKEKRRTILYSVWVD